MPTDQQPRKRPSANNANGPDAGTAHRGRREWLASIRGIELESGWVAQVQAAFKKVWVSMNDENRHRLLLVLVAKVVVDEASGEVSVTMADMAEVGQSAVA